LTLIACGTDPAASANDGGVCAPPTLPAATGETILIGAAGAPVSLFGPVDAPRFAEVFGDLAESGFDVFFPYFGTHEDASGQTSTDHYFYFLPPDALGADLPPAATSCATAFNPYAAAAGRLRILFPAYALVADDGQAPLDQAALGRRLDAFVATCLGGDPSVLAGWDSFDEPVNNLIASQYDDTPGTFDLDNVGSLAAVVRARSAAPLFLIEAAVPLALELFPDLAALPEATRAAIAADFWAGVARTVPTADWYGFDIYPVPLTSDLGVVGDWVEQARVHAPAARPLAVLQGFGLDDLGNGVGRRPTPAETRFMAFDALVHGARGLLWYGQSAMAIDADPALWDALRAVAREVRELAPVWSAPAATVATEPAAVAVDARVVGNVVWLIAVNRSDSETTLMVGIPPPPAGGAGSYAVYVPGSGAPVATGSLATGSRLSLALEAWGVQVVAITYC
jgi:hypothetical protein